MAKVKLIRGCLTKRFSKNIKNWFDKGFIFLFKKISYFGLSCKLQRNPYIDLFKGFCKKNLRVVTF